MSRNKKIMIFGLLLLLVPSLMVCGYEKETVKAKPKDDLYGQLELFGDAMSLVRSDYVEQTDSKKLVYGAMRGMLASLDDFSQFMEPEEYNEIKVETKGEFGGLGVDIGMREGVLTVIAPMSGTPAEGAGIEPGDRIVRIDGKATKDFSLDESVKLMRGKPGTVVSLTIWREKGSKILELSVKRAVISIQSVKKSELLNDKVGYIKLVEFQENTPRDLEAALKKLESQGMDALILDLRNNPGGLLDVSVYAAEKFLSKDKVVVSTKSRNKAQVVVFRSSGKFPHPDYPMVVLINGGSASGSEIVAGAIQDNKRGIILGTKSFGKASVQEIVPLRDGSAVKLTVASYVTPSGKLIAGNGIIPDILVEKTAAGEEAPVSEAKDIFDNLEESKAPVAAAKGAAKTESDGQLLRAVDILKAMKLMRNGTYHRS